MLRTRDTVEGIGAGTRKKPDTSDGLERRPRILLIEDDAEMRSLVASELRADGFEVVPTANSDEFLATIETLTGEYHLGQNAVALIVSDVRMPGLDGLDLLTALRCAAWKTPVVLMTAFASRETYEEAARLGAVVLDKPFELERLRAIARRLTRS